MTHVKLVLRQPFSIIRRFSSSNIKKNHWQIVRKNLDTLKTTNPSKLHSVHFVELIKAYSNNPSPMWRQALQILDEMRSEGHVPDVVAFNEVLEGLANARRWQDALALLVEMKSRFNRSQTESCYDVRTFNTVMRACAMGGAPREANELLNRMKVRSEVRGGLHLSPPSPNTESYNMAISGFAMAGWWEKALELLDELRSPHTTLVPNIHSYNWALLAVQSAPIQRRNKLARHLLKKMESENTEPNLVTFYRGAIALRDCAFPLTTEPVPPSWLDISMLFESGVKSGQLMLPSSSALHIDMTGYSPPLVKVALLSWFRLLLADQHKVMGDVSLCLSSTLENGTPFSGSFYVDWLNRFHPSISVTYELSGGNNQPVFNVTILRQSLQLWVDAHSSQDKLK